MRKVIVALSLVCVAALIANRPAPAAEEVMQWMTLQQAEEAYKKQARPILIDLYTDWCGWCKVMDKETYAKKEVANYIMQKFYPVKLNAEQKKAITFGGKTFQFSNQYRTHEFAIYLTRGQLSYPTTVIIPASGKMPQAIAGFMKPKDMEPIVKYFGEGQFEKIAFTDFEKKLKKSW
jgi:thioredoxin-related protein